MIEIHDRENRMEEAAPRLDPGEIVVEGDRGLTPAPPDSSRSRAPTPKASPSHGGMASESRFPIKKWGSMESHTVVP